MCENQNKKLPGMLDDSQLEQVTGGVIDYVCLDESNLPRGWVVTCSSCGLQFVVNSNKDCPSCGNTEVYMDYSNDKPVYDSVKVYGQ